MLIVMYVAVISSNTRNKKQNKKMGMTAEIEKLMMGYSWNVEKSIFFNFINY